MSRLSFGHLQRYPNIQGDLLRPFSIFRDILSHFSDILKTDFFSLRKPGIQEAVQIHSLAFLEMRAAQ